MLQAVADSDFEVLDEEQEENHSDEKEEKTKFVTSAPFDAEKFAASQLDKLGKVNPF